MTTQLGGWLDSGDRTELYLYTLSHQLSISYTLTLI